MTIPNLILDLKSDISVKRYRKYTQIDEKSDVLKNDLFSNSHAKLVTGHFG
jgi:hypothetical protein